jgi:hypothetical protein
VLAALVLFRGGPAVLGRYSHMAPESECRYRIFVSYAHVDDRVLPEADAGWVTRLVDNVKVMLPQELGRDECDLWLDRLALTPNDPLTAQIVEAVQSAHLLLVILSPGYIASSWCSKERNEFLQVVGGPGKSRTFLVKKQPVEETKRPEELRDLKGLDFWTMKEGGDAPRTLGFPVPDPKNPEDRMYYEKIKDLCVALAKELRRQSGITPERNRKSARIAVGNGKLEGTPVAVYLAPVNYDLEVTWESTQRYLDQVGVKVLPESAHSYVLNPESFREAAEKHLKECGVFIQLLSEIPFKEPPDSPVNYAQLQVELAQSLKKPIPILQWRHPQTKLSRVTDEPHRALLDSETVRAESLEDFKKEVRRCAFEKPPPDEPMTTYVLVDTTARDAPLAQQICDALLRYGVPVVVVKAPDEYDEGAKTDPQLVRKELEDNFKKCGALIVVYGESPSTWVIGQYQQWRKSQASRKRPPNALALFDGPPEMKGQVALPGVRVVDCRKAFDEAKLKQFLDEIRREAAP